MTPPTNHPARSMGLPLGVGIVAVRQLVRQHGTWGFHLGMGIVVVRQLFCQCEAWGFHLGMGGSPPEAEGRHSRRLRGVYNPNLILT